jgi:hypothetical protein
MRIGDVVKINRKSVLADRGIGTVISLVNGQFVEVKWDANHTSDVLHTLHLEVVMASSGTKMSSTRTQLKGKSLGDMDCSDPWLREYHSQSAPPPVPKEEKCTCETRKVVNFGCSCDAGKKELAKERAS